jgi:spore maturation protein CgeB
MFKKILIYGESWPGTLPQLLFVDLAKRGYAVEIFDFTDILPGIRNRSVLERVQRRLFSGFFTTRIRMAFLKRVEAFSPDLVLVSKGLHLDLETLEKIRLRGVTLVNWNPDDFFNMKNSSASLIEAMGSYDLIVSPRDHLFQKYREHGARQLLYLDWYFVPELHFDHQKVKTIPASFVGSWSPSREEFIGHLNITFRIWGGGWEKSSRVFKKLHDVQNTILSQLEMSAVFRSSKFNLNLLTHENCDFSNLRFFEVPASGGVLLTERNSSATRYLLDREECLMFSTTEEVNQIFTGHFDLDSIARAGNRRMTSGGNTFSNRVDDLMSFIKCHL